MVRRSDTRERIIDTAAQFFRTRGYASTGLKELVAASGAPWGSLYHYFPGGKEQLGVQAVLHAGLRYEALIDSAFEQASDPAAGLRNFFELSATALEESGYTDGCPLGTLALETASTSEPLRLACATAFDAWHSKICDIMTGSGLPDEQAESLATVILSTYEGAVMLSRTHRTTQPLHDGADAMAPLISAHIATVSREAYRRAIRRPMPTPTDNVRRAPQGKDSEVAPTGIAHLLGGTETGSAVTTERPLGSIAAEDTVNLADRDADQ